jgi:hypothetical protein
MLALSALFTLRKPDNNQKSITSNNVSVLFFSCFSIYLIMVLKASLTGDYSRYADNFYNSVNKTIQFYWERRIDPGFYIFTKIIGEIHYSSVFYFAVTSAIICISLFIFIKRYGDYKRYAIYFYLTIGLFAFTLAGLRQALAMSVSLFAYEAARKKKLISFLILIAIAYPFHKSALLFIPAYFIAQVPWKKKYHLVLLAVYGAIGLSFTRLHSIIADWLGYDYSIEQTGNGGIFLLILLIIGFLGIIYRKELFERYDDSLLFLNMHMAVILIWLLRMFTRTVERPAMYYLYASIILMDRILSLKSENEEKENTRKVIVFLSVVFFGFLFIYRTLRDGNLVPYVWIFDM